MVTLAHGATLRGAAAFNGDVAIARAHIGADVRIAGSATIGDSTYPVAAKLKVGHSATPPLHEVGVLLATDDLGLYAYNRTRNYSAILADPDWAAVFTGPVNVQGHLTKPAGSFKIDHPVDPANKYLSHSFVESPDMMNVYNGNVITDDRGEAVVTLPGYFEALNGGYRYQLTVIGQPAMAHVSEEIAGGRFAIQTDRPRVKVSWQVTGIRRDAYALPNPVRVEEDKPEHERRFDLHPILFGPPEDRLINRVSRPRTRSAHARTFPEPVSELGTRSPLRTRTPEV
jgi:hypothetical protein